MRKVIFNCVNNVILFALWGLIFMLPTSSYEQTESGITFQIFTAPQIIFFVYLIVYPIMRYLIRKKLNWSKKDNSELVFADEREKIIVAESTKTAYQVLIGGLLGSIAILGGLRFFSLFSQMEINIYFISVLLLTVLLIAAMVSYCIRWCIEYRK